jgi:hypothetical protein
MNVTAKQVGPKQFKENKRTWKMYVLQIAQTERKKELGKTKKDKKEDIRERFTLLFLLSTQGNNRLSLTTLTSP